MDDGRIANKPLPEQATFLGIIVGMAKDAGYTVDLFCELIRVSWPHVKPPHGEPWWSVTFACGHSFTGSTPRTPPTICHVCQKHTGK